MMGVVDEPSDNAIFFFCLKKSRSIMEFGGIDMQFFSCGWRQPLGNQRLDDMMDILW